MIKKDELIKLQKETGLLLSTIEKDYVLGLLVWSFTQNKNLNTQWVFKGGTCLKKCYFEDYRFSEDLDYTVIPEAPIDQTYIRKELSVCSELFKNQELKISLLHEVAIKKFKVKHLEFPQSLNEIPKKSIEEVISDWQEMLSHQVKNLPEIGIYINKLDELLKAILSLI